MLARISNNVSITVKTILAIHAVASKSILLSITSVSSKNINFQILLENLYKFDHSINTDRVF